MKLQQLFTDDDAVSPVIGVILMVAITVILAAVIGAFVMGFSPGDNAAPQANWDVTEEPTWNNSNGGGLVFTHEGGEDVDGAQLTTGSNVHDFNASASTHNPYDSGVYGVGDTIAVNVLASAEAGDEVTIAYASGDSSQVVATHTLSSNW